MPHLDLRQAQRLRAALAPLYDEPPAATSFQRLADAVNDLFGGESTCFDVFDAAGRLRNLASNATALFTPAVLQHLFPRIQEHPLFEGIFVQRQDIPLKISDYCPGQQFFRRAIYQDFYRPINVRFQLIVSLPVPGLGFATCAVARARRDFTEAERTLLAFAQPHLTQLLPRPAPAPHPLPDSLTPREQQVLRYLTLGQQDKEIAARCGLSPRTVQVHLRNIYAKLGVSNRTEACLWALGRG